MFDPDAWYYVPGWFRAHRLNAERLGYTRCGRSVMGVDMRLHVAIADQELCPTCLGVEVSGARIGVQDH